MLKKHFKYNFFDKKLILSNFTPLSKYQASHFYQGIISALKFQC